MSMSTALSLTANEKSDQKKGKGTNYTGDGVPGYMVSDHAISCTQCVLYCLEEANNYPFRSFSFS